MKNRKLRILQLIYSFDIEGGGGGISRFVLALCQNLDKNIFDVSVCGLWSTGKSRELANISLLKSQGIDAFTASTIDLQHPVKSLWNSYKKLRDYIKQNHIDIVHSHSEFSDIVTLMLKISPGVPIIMRTVHYGYRVEWRNHLIRRILLTNFLYPIFLHEEIGVAGHITHNLDNRLLSKLLRRKSLLIHNSIDISKFSGVYRLSDKRYAGLPINENAIVIGTIGRLTVQKGYDILLDAFCNVVQKKSDPIILIIIGTGELEETLKKSTEILGIKDKVIFTGPRSDIEKLLTVMDLFVCSSRWEGFSTAILEAMAVGIPVLATDIPGNRDMINHQQNGWLVESNNPSALADAIDKIIELPSEVRLRIGEEGKKTSLKYKISDVAERHHLLYTK